MRGLDIFSGAGGSSCGARAAGIEIIAAVDVSPMATETFRANFPGAEVITDRLENIDKAAFKKHLGTIDLLLASPECTDHTCAKGAAVRDEESRATAMQVVEYAEYFRPRWLVLENVVHMRPWSRYGELKAALLRIGYQIAEQVLDASDFGVAQRRRRLFIVGDRDRPPVLVSETECSEPKSAKSILDPDGLWKTSPLDNGRRATATLQRAERAFAELGRNANFLLVYYGSDGAGGWQTLNRPLRTVTTVDRFALVNAQYGEPTMRMLQVSELRRAMGFDDTFLLPVGSRRDRIRLLGNGVCPPVMKAVVQALTS